MMIHDIFLTCDRKGDNTYGIDYSFEYFHILFCFKIMVDSAYGQCLMGAKTIVILRHNCIINILGDSTDTIGNLFLYMKNTHPVIYI